MLLKTQRVHVLKMQSVHVERFKNAKRSCCGLLKIQRISCCVLLKTQSVYFACFWKTPFVNVAVQKTNCEHFVFFKTCNMNT